MAGATGTALSNQEFHVIDGNSPHFGVSLQRLMENAAKAVADEVVKRRPARVLVVCGPGNNGGDGLAMVPLLPPSIETRIVLAGSTDGGKTREAKWALGRLDPHRHPVEGYRSPQRLRELVRDVDLVVDALLGSGIEGDLREPIRTIVRTLNASRRPILSVDVPTGLGGKTAIRPLLTVALHDKKQGMTRTNSGRIIVRDIGVPREAIEQVGPADFFVAYPRNEPRSHKGQNGRLLVVAGGPYTGAPVLCAQSAIRCGIDYVRLYTPRDGALVAQATQTDLVVHPGTRDRAIVPQDVEPILKLLDKVDCLLMGPGMGAQRATGEAITAILRAAARRRVRTVLDADALVVAGKDPALVRRLRPVVTPHPGEYRELTRHALPKDAEKARTAARGEARRLQSVFLVKGAQDIITDGNRVKVNLRFHHPAMTTGGTGDVLAGITAALVAKHMDPFQAACAASFLNGDCGREVARRQGGTLVASDLIHEIPRAFDRWLGVP